MKRKAVGDLVCLVLWNAFIFEAFEQGVSAVFAVPVALLGTGGFIHLFNIDEKG